MSKKIKVGDRVRVRGGRRLQATVMEMQGRQVKVNWDCDGPDHDWKRNGFTSVFCFEPISPASEASGREVGARWKTSGGENATVLFANRDGILLDFDDEDVSWYTNRDIALEHAMPVVKEPEKHETFVRLDEAGFGAAFKELKNAETFYPQYKRIVTILKITWTDDGHYEFERVR